MPQNTLSTRLKKKDELKAKFLQGDLEPERKKFRTAKFPELEAALVVWFKNARSQNIAVDGEIMRAKARDFARQLQIPASEFECSSG